MSVSAELCDVGVVLIIDLLSSISVSNSNTNSNIKCNSYSKTPS